MKSKAHRARATRLAICMSLAGTAITHADLTWDPDGGGNNNGGIGNWNTVTNNWWDGGAAVVWDNTGAQTALLGQNGLSYTISLSTGITVGHITLDTDTGDGTVSLIPGADDETLNIKSGGATWELGGRSLNLGTGGTNDLNLSMVGGDTLSITNTTGTGNSFWNANRLSDSGTWNVATASLDIGSNVFVRSNLNSVGQFPTVTLADNTEYYHGNTVAENYPGNWVLNGRTVFGNLEDGVDFTLSGEVSGAGTLVCNDTEGAAISLIGAANTFSGGVEIDSTASETVLRILEDADLGAVPGAVDDDYIKLINGGVLFGEGVDIAANRGITLDGGGIYVCANAASSYAGKITGTGGFQIGRDDGYANQLTLSGDQHDYTGGTRIRKPHRARSQ